MKEKGTAPESVVLAFKVWVAVLILEIVHQITSVLTALMDRENTTATIIEQYKQSQAAVIPSETFVSTVVIGSSIFVGCVALAIIGIVLWLARSYVSAGPRAGTARKVLTYFGVFFALRCIFAFKAPTLSMVPIGVQAFNGSVEIAVGVAAVVGTILVSKPDSLEWVGDNLSAKKPKKPQR
ncbi:hypothetical protein P4N68_02545 [Corynebacterium felinum]|uniref:Uncharacterized protein n=1 Tax=Corynebacterium felinum TaxID=131318 RepID=A0ABU2B8G1_9CORY|nr:hypothetical protein [Corynebacterium felinum]MDF5819962.1 hypothetical protein [Corynebacterium felinum]MDR7354551.1 hypothetical protein [Corynebacterium felinum]